MKTKMLTVGLVPDRFAHYRYPIFKLLSNEDFNNFRLYIFADTKEVDQIVTAPNSFCDLDIKNGGIRWHKTNDIYFKKIKIWSTGLIKLALDDSYDAIVYWGDAYQISIWISAIIAKLMKKKIVFWTHGLYGNENLFKYFLRKTFYNLADGLLLYGNHAKKLLEPTVKNNVKMYVINNSLDYEIQNKIYTNLTTEDLQKLKKQLFAIEDKVICFIGRLKAKKNISLLIKSLNIIKNKYSKSVKLLLIGDGPEREKLVHLAKHFKLESDVVFFGSCYDEQKNISFLAMSDVVVSPGEVGLTAMHSLISGTPVITHNDFSFQMPEVEAIRNGVNGFFFEKDNETDLADKIIECFKFLESGKISSDSCRSVILTKYTPSYQLKVFNSMLNDLYS